MCAGLCSRNAPRALGATLCKREELLLICSTYLPGGNVIIGGWLRTRPPRGAESASPNLLTLPVNDNLAWGGISAAPRLPRAPANGGLSMLCTGTR